jgi:hypothetical protein
MLEAGSSPTAAAALEAEESGTALGIAETRSSSMATRTAATFVCNMPVADDASVYLSSNLAREADTCRRCMQRYMSKTAENSLL